MLYICLPAYNEEKCIKTLLYKVKDALEKRNYDYSVIVYDDGSTDNTLQLAKECTKDIPIEIIEGRINKGLGYALKALLETVIRKSVADKNIAVVLDADDTHNPEHIFRMVELINEGYDLIIGSRFRENSRVVGVPRYRNYLSYGASLLMRLLFPIKGVKDYTCGYRAYKVDILKKAKAKYKDRLFTEKGFTCMAELIIKLRKLDLLASEIPIILRYDKKQSKSKMNVAKNVFHALGMLARLRFKL